MNTHFKSALNKIKAEDELVDRTEKYLRSALDNPNQEKTLPIKKRSCNQMKKTLAVSVAAVFVISTFVGGYTYLKTPVAYISLDINPSVELGINAYNNVISAEGVNEDGQAILEGQDIINTDVSDALDQLIDSAAEKDYIKDDGTTVISITAESNNDDKAVKLNDISEQAVNNSLNGIETNAIIYKDCSDLSLRTEAKDLGISPGKLKLIKFLQALDPTITVDQLKDAKVSDIMLKANELISSLDTNNDGSELSESQKEAVERLKETAQKTNECVNDASKAQFEAAKEQAKNMFEDAKNQAESIKNDAKTKAEELRKQSQTLLKNTDGMTEAEKEAVKAQAEELRIQAEALIREAENQAEELKNTAEKQKDEAIEAAEKLKNAAEANNKEESTVEYNENYTSESQEESNIEDGTGNSSKAQEKAKTEDNNGQKNNEKSVESNYGNDGNQQNANNEKKQK